MVPYSAGCSLAPGAKKSVSSGPNGLYGYYTRVRWPTALGTLRDVRMSPCRDSDLSAHLLARLEDHREALGWSVVERLLAGVSTHRVSKLFERIIDLPVSAGQVSKLAMRLDADVRTSHTQVIADEVAYLLLDAIHLKARSTPRLFQTGRYLASLRPPGARPSQGLPRVGPAEDLNADALDTIRSGAPAPFGPLKLRLNVPTPRDSLCGRLGPRAYCCPSCFIGPTPPG